MSGATPDNYMRSQYNIILIMIHDPD